MARAVMGLGPMLLGRMRLMRRTMLRMMRGLGLCLFHKDGRSRDCGSHKGGHAEEKRTAADLLLAGISTHSVSCLGIYDGGTTEEGLSPCLLP